MEEAKALKDVFLACRGGCEDLEQGPSKVAEEKKLELKGKILECMKMVDTLALFSDNEDKDDIITSHLKFLLLPYFLGLYHMYGNSQSGGSGARGTTTTATTDQVQVVDTLSRLDHVREALVCFRGFIEQCAVKDLLEDKVKKLVERICLDSCDGNGDGLDSNESGQRPAVKFGREEKISLYRRQKELKAMMETLRALEDDEENARSLSLLDLNNSAMNACQHYASLEKEAELLQFAEANREHLPRMHEERERATGQEKMKMFESLKSTAAALNLQADRERFAQGVFKPSHILPTMTVEEFGELELERMQIREERQRQQQQQQGDGKAKCCSDPDDHSEDEQCLKKAREWDDFKDDNPFGSGNSNLRPCA